MRCLLFLSLVALTFAQSSDLFDCASAGIVDISSFYSLKEQANIARVTCLDNKFRGDACANYYSLAARLVNEEFNLNCEMKQFLTNFKLALSPVNTDGLKTTLETMRDSIGSPIMPTITSSLATLTNALVNSGQASSAEKTLRDRIETKSLYTDDAELDTFRQALETRNSDKRTELYAAIDDKIDTIIDAVIEAVVDTSKPTGTVESRLSSLITDVKDTINTKTDEILTQIAETRVEETRRWLELIAGSGRNGLVRQNVIWGAVLPYSAKNPYYTKNALVSLVEDVFALTGANDESNQKPCTTLTAQALALSSSSDPRDYLPAYNALQSAYSCLLQQIWNNV